MKLFDQYALIPRHKLDEPYKTTPLERAIERVIEAAGAMKLPRREIRCGCNTCELARAMDSLAELTASGHMQTGAAMTPPSSEYEDIEARLKATSQGHWIAFPDCGVWAVNYIDNLGNEQQALAEVYGGERSEANAIFIAKAPTDIATLLREVSRAKGRIAELESALQPFAEYSAVYVPAADDSLRVAQWQNRQITVGDLRKAASARKGGE